jgi:hypothetical protein
MSKILVVETHRMLQQAIALALFPEHEVKIVSAIPESSELKDFDAVIVDVKSLGESAGVLKGDPSGPELESSNRLGARFFSWTNTTRENLIALIAPIEKDVCCRL